MGPDAGVRPHVGVVGGGIAGLAAAYRLSQAGVRVTLLESSGRLGGLGSFFEFRDVALERFYHCMLPTDRHLLALLRDIGLEGEIYWNRTSFGYMKNGVLHALNTPLDLLRFSPLSMIDRVRVGATGAWGSVRSARGLDDITCEKWLTGLSGQRAFDTFWRPMLEAKFGDRYSEVPALWFWKRFNREKGAKVERKGYIRGGYRRIIDRLAQVLRESGVALKLDTAVERLSIEGDGRVQVQVRGGDPLTFDKIVYAGPIIALRDLVDVDGLGCGLQDIGAGIDMQGVVNAVLLLKRGFTPHYWVAAVDPEVPFQGIVESTTLVDKRETGGAHLVYLMNYLHRSDPRFARDDGAILADYLAGLTRMFPDLRDDDIIATRVFRSPFVEPLYSVGYEARKPPLELVAGRIFLSTTAQVYPEVTSWNGSVGLSDAVVHRMLTGVPVAGKA